MALSGFGQSQVQQAMLVFKEDDPGSKLTEISLEQFERCILPILQSYHKAHEERMLKLRQRRSTTTHIFQETAVASSGPVASKVNISLSGSEGQVIEVKPSPIL